MTPRASTAVIPWTPRPRTHWVDVDGLGTGYGHRGLCCDCMDLSCGMALNGPHSINEERMAKGKAPITKCWPGWDEHGNRLPK